MSQRSSLDEPRRQTLDAATRRLLPSDEGVGAAETGVADYIEKSLREKALEDLKPLIERGLDLLESLARDRFGRAFAACSRQDQEDLLANLERLDEPWPRVFLRRLVLLTLEGFLCDPRHGGNRGGRGWTYIGYMPEAQAPEAPDLDSGHRTRS